MGEYADMMLDGTCCAGCGEFLFDDDPLGIPTYCPACAGHFDDGGLLPVWDAPAVGCPSCNRVFGSERAMRQHYGAKHPPKTHQCSDCPKKFASDQALNDHRKAKHETPQQT